MDTAVAAKVDVSGKVDEIKRYMPKTYKCIQDKAGEIGNEAFTLVRRGLRGEVNCFYAFEAGRVVGTPFAAGPIPDKLAALMVEFGVAMCCIWQAPEGSGDGAH